MIDEIKELTATAAKLKFATKYDWKKDDGFMVDIAMRASVVLIMNLNSTIPQLELTEKYFIRALNKNKKLIVDEIVDLMLSDAKNMSAIALSKIEKEKKEIKDLLDYE